MKVTVVGCSGSIPGPQGPSSCYLVDHDGFRVVLDLGHGSLGAIQQYCALVDIDAIVISHLHPDHCIDLTALHIAHRYGDYSFRGPIPVYGPRDTAERIAAASGMRTTAPLRESFGLHDVAVTAGFGPFRVRAERVAHPVEAYAVRFEAGGQSLVYSGDTGPCAALDELAAGADLLLCEASFRHGDDNPTDLHLTGREAGECARDSGAHRLVLTHVPPWHDAATAVSEATAVFDGRIDLAAPGEVYDLSG